MLKIWKTRRYVVAVLAFLGYFGSYLMRVNLSVAIVAMTANKTVLDANGDITYQQEFMWDSKLQGFLLSSFFYGYVTTQLLGGWLATKLGGVKVYGITITVTAILSLLTPLAAKHSFEMVLFVRIMEGIIEGAALPCIYAFWSHWAPALERSRLISSTLAGGFLGTVVAMPVSAYLNKAFGWESIFYVPGAFCLVWFIFWWLYVSETPKRDRYITTKELEYITGTLENEVHQTDMKHPWLKIMTSKPALACMVAHFVENYGFYTMMAYLPKFMTDVLNFDLEIAGIMSAIPFMVMSVILLTAGQLADYLATKKNFTTGQVRKLLTCGAFLSQTAFLALCAFIMTPLETTIFLSLAIGLGGCAWAGFGVNYLEIAPRHASVMFGIGGTLATISGIVGPIIIGNIVTTPSREEWQIVFLIASGVYLVGAVLYGYMASGELQPWA